MNFGVKASYFHFRIKIIKRLAAFHCSHKHAAEIISYFDFYVPFDSLPNFPETYFGEVKDQVVGNE